MAVVADVGNETENVQGQGEEAAGVGKEVEIGRGGAGAGIARETGTEAKAWMGKRSVRGMGSQRVGSECHRSTREKWLRAQRIAKTGTKIKTETEGGAIGTETGVGTGTETGSIRGTVGRETGGSGERIATPPHEMTQAPMTKWAMRMMLCQPTWMSSVRME